MIISNASPLIYLAKIKKLDLLKSLFKEIIIPKEVFDEVVTKGKEEKFLEVFHIDNAIKSGWIKIKEIEINKELEKLSAEIDMGENSVINLARKLNANLLLIDDASARTIAESLGFNVKGTLYVILKAYKRKFIEKNEAKQILNKLIFEGFRISQEIYIQFIEELEKT